MADGLIESLMFSVHDILLSANSWINELLLTSCNGCSFDTALVGFNGVSRFVILRLLRFVRTRERDVKNSCKCVFVSGRSNRSLRTITFELSDCGLNDRIKSATVALFVCHSGF